MIYLYVTSALFHVIVGGILALSALLYFTRSKSGKQLFPEEPGTPSGVVKVGTDDKQDVYPPFV